MSKFKEALMALCPALDADSLKAMEAYYRALMQTNKETNLTTITDEVEAAEKHFYDSIVPAEMIPQNALVIDVGTGGGFPGVPLKICRPDISLTLLESVQKKTEFLKTATAALKIPATVLCERAEILGKGEARESFDVCVSRAVASLAQLCELCLPLVKPGGIFLAYKADYKEELVQAQNALVCLGGEFTEVFSGGGQSQHAVLVIRKNKQTPEKYPRRYARILKNTL